MAYYKGIAQSPNELLSALQNACTANGWALTNNVLSKNNCYVNPYVAGNTIALKGAADSAFTVTSNTVSHSGLGQDLSYPLNYHIHVNNMEVYFFLNYNVNFYSYLAFGQSPFGELPGTGNWVSGMYDGRSNLSISNAGWGQTDLNAIPSMMFSDVPNSTNTTHSYFHHGINAQWSGSNRNETNSRAMATQGCFPLLRDQPNPWNGEAILIPIRPMIYYEGSRFVLVGQLQNAFYVRIDNYDPEQVITIANEKYKIYPWSRKNTEDRNVRGSITSTLNHSGTFGVAVSYDGD